MAGTSGRLGKRHDVPVRLGNSMPPQNVTLRLRAGQPLNTEGGRLRTAIFLRENDTTPLMLDPFEVVQLAPLPTGEPRFRLTLSREKLFDLVRVPEPVAPPVSSAAALRNKSVRTFYWTSSWQDAEGVWLAVAYGRIPIVLGAAGG